MESSFPYPPCKAWTPCNTDKGVNSTWLYFVLSRIQHQEERLSFILILLLRSVQVHRVRIIEMCFLQYVCTSIWIAVANLRTFFEKHLKNSIYFLYKRKVRGYLYGAKTRSTCQNCSYQGIRRRSRGCVRIRKICEFPLRA